MMTTDKSQASSSQAPPPAANVDPLQAALADVQSAYPVFRELNVAIQRGSGPGHLEFYPPDEDMNPNPGRITLEVRNKNLKGDELKSMLAGDLLHYIGGTSGESRAPNHPAFRAQKEAFMQSLTPDQKFIISHMYSDAKQRGALGPQVTEDEFSDFSGSDAFIRGYLFPDKADEFRRPGFGEYTPEQIEILKKMESLINPSTPNAK